MTDIKTAADVASRAAELVGGDREAQHGSKLANMSNIAALWNAYLLLRVNRNGGVAALKPHEVAEMMVLLKVARMTLGAFNPDDYVDAAGYAGVAYETRLEGEKL